ncbi:MAG TPA: hypothetical protein PK054_12900 [Anaerohalosphaeraceae bacterium]|nr:hypothetical protein [Anaerohalosphaeraceae bacterium]HOL90066.1 hypothetical protein [Anaerohalosphaeraceae bacterium]HPP57465.1 hypothetical protein [Anaerohalosphaeraceae bacterium]
MFTGRVPAPFPAVEGCGEASEVLEEAEEESALAEFEPEAEEAAEEEPEDEELVEELMAAATEEEPPVEGFDKTAPPDSETAELEGEDSGTRVRSGELI